MEFAIVKSILVLKMDMIATTALAGLLLVMGYWLRNKVDFFNRFCIPAPVIGGFAFALLALIFKETGVVNFQFTTSLQSPFMIAFFTTVGLGGSLALMRQGGKALLIYLFFCWFISIFQNTFGAALASAFGIHPVLGVMAGAVSLEGGHGAAAAFGPTAEALGVKGATAVAIASATFGLIAGGLLGGPVAKFLIEKNHVVVEASKEHFSSFEEAVGGATEETIESKGLIRMMVLVLVVMAIGALVSGKLKVATGFDLPGYVGAMIIAVIFRNINDQFNMLKINMKNIDLMADISIGMFLTMAMMTLRIWDLYDLALPLISILVLQTIALTLLAVFVLFRLLGKDYDAVVICAGLMGHGLGATPNAVANMGAVCEHYNVMSYKAFLIVPLCGAVLIDMVGLPCIVWFINHFAG